ncbi:co-regulatory protein PtrA N-terminal domain-containing protein [Pseudomonas benzenivorans]|uniref:Co-regulatory protein PtrA N-terminal domain-containing protein n=1 Tax=Pseudomonas benzenivorans TaxID=556533 RepID=A0ABZ0PZ33_9PSED|nr:co-regulatory protein PtrA N-terminal domain-containing protein [Pseudomonas benzenivorans]WPC06443.1 co-regulatory protein PtrA N-terminal domain-containing protein [Pseudomonas benzenivorans]
MNTLKTLFAIAALSLSSLAMAEGGGDRTFARMQSSETLTAQAAQQPKAAEPVAGMKMKKAEHAKC